MNRTSAKELTKAEALEILSSALMYCQQAGLQIYAANATEGLRIYLPQVALTVDEENKHKLILTDEK